MIRLAVFVLLLVGVFLGGCASDPKPRASLADQGVTDEGPNRSVHRVNREGASGSTSYPSSSVLISDGTDATDPVLDAEGNVIEPGKPATAPTMNSSKPSSTSTVMVDPLGTWADIAGIVRLVGAKVKVTDADGAVSTFEADEITVDNKATLEGAAVWATASERIILGMSADQREAFKAQVEANRDVLKALFPELFSALRAALGIP
jgi:hypothetical protein